MSATAALLARFCLRPPSRPLCLLSLLHHCSAYCTSALQDLLSQVLICAEHWQLLPPCYPQVSFLAVNRFPHSFIPSFIYCLPPCQALDSGLEEMAQRLCLLPDLGREQETGSENVTAEGTRDLDTNQGSQPSLINRK